MRSQDDTAKTHRVIPRRISAPPDLNPSPSAKLLSRSARQSIPEMSGDCIEQWSRGVKMPAGPPRSHSVNVPLTLTPPAQPLGAPTHRWQREAVVYEVYWRRFNCDEAGQRGAQGLTAKLDYLRDIGVTVIWITPMFPSPLVDGGYDVSEFMDCHPDFGSLNDFRRLIDECKVRGMRVMLDMVLNHVSDRHPWFQEALTGGPKRDWFIWANGRGPNNEIPSSAPSAFSTPRWKYFPEVGKWGLNSFAPEQRDLNWRNREVRQAVADVLEFWLEQGVAGFRFDALDDIDKTRRHRRLLSYIQELRRVLGDDVMTVGEMPFINPPFAKKFTDPEHNGLDMVFHFELPRLQVGASRWDARVASVDSIRHVTTSWQTYMQGQGLTHYLGNHDWPRVVSRFGNPNEYRNESAKLLATYQLTLPGTPFIYQGDELGEVNWKGDSIEDYSDVETLNAYHAMRRRGTPHEQAFDCVQKNSRDAARAAMPWDEAHRQQNDPGSVFSHYRSLLQLRRKHPVFVYGEYREEAPHRDSNAFVFSLRHEHERAWVVLNMGNETLRYEAAEPLAESWTLALGTHASENAYDQHFSPWEGRVYLSQGPATDGQLSLSPP